MGFGAVMRPDSFIDSGINQLLLYLLVYFVMYRPIPLPRRKS